MPDRVPLDFGFYSEPRFPGTPESVITGFLRALRNLIRRTASDLRSGRRGPFASSTEALFSEPLATSVDRLNAHVDALESVSMHSELPAANASRLRTILANVLNDSGFTQAAEAHINAPSDEESKFDEHKGGVLIEILGDIGGKLEPLASLFEIESAIIKLIALILKDLGFPGKLTETVATNKIAKQVENKLREVINHVQGAPDALARISSTVNDSHNEINKIELKADALGSLLGRTLVGERWVADPSQPGFTSNKLPPKDIKAELHDIEDLLNQIVQRLPPTIDKVPDGNGDGDPKKKYDKPPGNPKRPVLRDERLKKIFVWAQNIFAATQASDDRVIEVQTPAFDVSGWVDLSNLRAGDEAEVQVDVSLLGRSPVQFARTRFAQPGLKSFADICGGLNYVSGSNITITLRQPVSADSFATPVEVIYQFVVESM